MSLKVLTETRHEWPYYNRLVQFRVLEESDLNDAASKRYCSLFRWMRGLQRPSWPDDGQRLDMQLKI